jgi:quinolinate synthase
VEPREPRRKRERAAQQQPNPKTFVSNLIQIGTTDPTAQVPESISVPEVEKGVGCDLDSYLFSPDGSWDERIASAKERLGSRVVILGHHYQRDEVVKFADFRGDSLKLSQQAAGTDAEYIVFCGVHFMAESADVLRRPHQVVVLPDLGAGCSMADMAEIGQVESCWEELWAAGIGGVVPITYMNSTAAIKAFTGRHGGAVCTSSNANAVMRWAFEQGERVLFLPDEHLGRNTAVALGMEPGRMVVWDPAKELGGNDEQSLARARVILWKGYCSVHQRFQPEHVDRVRLEYPDIRVIVHPECRAEVVGKADVVGSTEKIIKAVSEAGPGSSWAIGTEIHLVNRLAREFPEQQIVSLDPHVCVCTTMFRISPQHLAWALENLAEDRVVNRIEVDAATRQWARVALERMLELR